MKKSLSFFAYFFIYVHNYYVDVSVGERKDDGEAHDGEDHECI